jgi:hypothetical protein
MAILSCNFKPFLSNKNQGVLTMKKFYVLLTFLIFVGIFIPTVSADEIIENESYVYYLGGIITSTVTEVGEPGGIGNYGLDKIGVRYPHTLNPSALVYAPYNKIKCSNSSIFYDRKPFTITYGGKIRATGHRTVYLSPDESDNDYIVWTFDTWDWSDTTVTITGLSTKILWGNSPSYSLTGGGYTATIGSHPDQQIWGGTDQYIYYGKHTYNAVDPWTNKVSAIKMGESVILSVEKTIDGVTSNSKVSIRSLIKSQPYYVGTINPNDVSVTVSLNDAPYEISVYSPVNGKWYNRTVFELDSLTPTPTDPDESPTLTVYIKNSQTGALIANANVAIDALVNGEYYSVTNRTEPSGIFTINLQPTGGGKPNPDGYRLIVTADGYNNPMPEINFTVDDYKNYIHCLLDPIAGGPVNENKTFIDFFVRDMSSNPISGATVKFGKYTLITNSAGYTVFEVDKNNNYAWTVSKSGYGALTGNAVIGDAPRHTINTVLAPIVTPTITTPIPTSPPIGPHPTMTAPTGEHVSNWLEWFAAHFGMILGGGVEIGKIFMWLCFTVPVGVYVGKEAKAGAAGFMAGAGIVTLFFVLIGWVPIWLVVLLALIIGLLYAKVFNAQDNGGGR